MNSTADKFAVNPVCPIYRTLCKLRHTWAMRPVRDELSVDNAESGVARPEHPVMLVFPHAGATRLAYHRLGQELADQLTLRMMDLPGRPGRQDESLPTAMPDLLTAMTPLVDAAAVENCLLYGHSLGALLAFETARRLTAQGRPPALLVVSGRNGPSQGSAYRAIRRLPDAEFLAAVAGMDSTMQSLQDEPDLAKLFLPVLRADLTIAETYAYQPSETLLPCPILSFQGIEDPMVSRSGVWSWAVETTAGCAINWLPGQHFFHLTRPEFRAALPGAIAAALAGCP